MGFKVFSLDIHPFKGIDLVGDILDVTVDQIPFVPDVIWASPPCTFFSVASIGHHWHPDHTPKTENALLGVRIVQKTIDIIDHFVDLNPECKWFVENPRGKLRKLPVVADRPRTTIMYCKYGDTRMKPTDIWSNYIADMFNIGWQPRAECFNGNRDCHHEAAPRGSRTGTQGMENAYEKSKIPSKLITEILTAVRADAR
jgi:site-specific DNA-cytosine methylase